MPADGDPLEYAEGLIVDGRPDAAARFLSARIAAGRGGLLARLLLVQAHLGADDVASALEAARDAVSLNPNVAQAVTALGEALLAAGLLPAAIAEFQRALRLDPDFAQARLKLGLAWLEAGEADRALEQFVALEDVEDHVARARAVQAQKRSDAGYVRHLFDQFSGDYDQRMRVQLRYQAPEILRQLADMVLPGAHGLAALDLGCGTGFAAQAFADLTSAIDGIDLSPAMIAKARARGLYRDLAVADIESALAAGGADYDLIIAADTLVYLGDLAATFAGTARRLKPGGAFLFTVEASGGADFELGPKRRWRHSDGYLRELASNVGLDVLGIVSCAPRFEANSPVDGFAAALSKL